MKYSDMTIGARELQIFADQNPQLVKLKMAWAKNLATKKARGVYHRELAIKAFMHFAREAAIGYVKEYGSRDTKWNVMFDKGDRECFARYYEAWFRGQYAAGAFESILPKKYQKAATRKKTEKAFKLAAESGALRKAPRKKATKKRAKKKVAKKRAKKKTAKMAKTRPVPSEKLITPRSVARKRLGLRG